MNMIFIGLDVHKDSIRAYGFNGKTGEVVLEKTLLNDTAKVIKEIKLLRKPRVKIQVCYEAGCLGFGLYRELEKNGIKCDVIAPSRIPKQAGDRIKTDKRDAEKLATLYASGQLTSIKVPNEEMESVRSFIRLREDVRADEHKGKQRLLGFCLSHNAIYRDGRHWTQKHITFLKSIKFNDIYLQATFDSYLSEVLRQSLRLHEIDEKIKEIAVSKPFTERVTLLRSLKGIDYYSALTLVVEIGDFNRFNSASHFMSYIGLVPGQRSSGNTIRMTGITKTGNGFIRKILNQASQCYRFKSLPSERLSAKRVGIKPNVLTYVEKAQVRCENKFKKMISRNKTYQTTVTAVSRELSGFIWGLMTGKIAA